MLYTLLPFYCNGKLITCWAHISVSLYHKKQFCWNLNKQVRIPEPGAHPPDMVQAQCQGKDMGDYMFSAAELPETEVENFAWDEMQY